MINNIECPICGVYVIVFVNDMVWICPNCKAEGSYNKNYECTVKYRSSFKIRRK